MMRVFREVREASQAMHAWHSTVVGAALGVRTLAKTSHRLTIRFDSSEAAEVAEELLGVKLNEHKHLQIRRDKTDVEVVMVPATKGTAVAELARHLGLTRENVLAIGNGQNDLSMLDGAYAAMTGCPANSTYDVMECVHRSRGHIASQKSLSGVLEIIDAHLFGSVDSTLPPEPSGNKSPVLGRSRRRSRSHKSRPSLKRGRLLLFGIILYSGLLAFASFDLVPFSHLIIKPLQWINAVLVKILSVF